MEQKLIYIAQGSIGAPEPEPDPTCVVGGKSGIKTTFGCMPFDDSVTLASSLAGFAVGISGGITLLIIGVSAIRVMTSAGDPKSLQGAKDALFSSISALIMIILAGFVLRLIGVNVLGLF